MNYIEIAKKIRWFLGELRRMKIGILGFALLFIFVSIAVAFPYLTNPKDVEYWSGHTEYWEERMLPKLAPPVWVNMFSSTKSPVTSDLKYQENLQMLDMYNPDDLKTYLKELDPKTFEALQKLPEDMQKKALDMLKDQLGFRYLVYYEATVKYTFTEDLPPRDIVAELSLGPIYLYSGLKQGLRVELERPDGIRMVLTPGIYPDTGSVYDINRYTDITDPNLPKIGVSFITTTANISGTQVKVIPANTSWVFSLSDLINKLLTSSDPGLINPILGPLLSAANETLVPGMKVDPLTMITSKSGKGMTSGATGPLHGDYVLKIMFLVRVPKDHQLPELHVEKARVLGLYGLMGTDYLGRDLWSAIIYGVRWALIIGITVSVISVIIGVLYGTISGYLGGKVDSVMLRIAQIWYSLPVLPLLIILAYFFGQNIWNIVWILIVFGWVGMVFTVRSMVLQIKENVYIEAARAIGASSWRIITRHVFPQILPYTFASIALSVPGAILAEAGLSFLGLGDPALVTWGKILHEAELNGALLKGAWWWVLPPGLGIALVGMTFVFIGYALDKILNPRLIR